MGLRSSPKTGSSKPGQGRRIQVTKAGLRLGKAPYRKMGQGPGASLRQAPLDGDKPQGMK